MEKLVLNPTSAHKQYRTALIVLGGLIGLCAIVIPELAELTQPYRSVFQHIGTALFVAALLALTIDKWFKQDIARDAFEAAIGYLLPEELREEMRYIYANRVICEKHIQGIEISRIDSGRVRLRSTVERVFRNNSDAVAEMPLALSVDEWSEPEKSKINYFNYKLEGEVNESRVDMAKLESGKYNLKLPDGHNIALRPRQSVRVTYGYEETKRANDSHLNNFSYPTKNPRVQVQICDGLEYYVGFSNRKDAPREQYANDTWEMIGMLLPHQYIYFRWWDASSGGLPIPASFASSGARPDAS